MGASQPVRKFPFKSELSLPAFNLNPFLSDGTPAAVTACVFVCTLSFSSIAGQWFETFILKACFDLIPFI